MLIVLYHRVNIPVAVRVLLFTLAHRVGMLVLAQGGNVSPILTPVFCQVAQVEFVL